MADTLTLTTPLTAPTTFKVARLLLDPRNSSIQVVLAEWFGGSFVTGGREFYALYNGAIADSLLAIVNTTNHSVTSPQSQVTQKVISDLKIPAGTVA